MNRVRREELPAIDAPYLLCLNVPCYRDSAGRRYFDPLWHKDLVQHVCYLRNLTLACPCRTGEPPADAIEWALPLPEIHFVDLPASRSFLEAMLHLPSTAARLWKAIGRADIVHSGVAGWPIPIGWTASLIAAMRQKYSVIVVESAPWRLSPGLPVDFRKRLRARMSETFSRWCVNHASLFIATQPEYLATLGPNRGYVIHASWLDEDTILSPKEAQESWRRKRLGPGEPVRILFAGRLDRSKGVLLLLEAMRLLDQERVPIKLDILGQGELLHECERAAQDLQGAARVRTLGTVAYGPAFFDLLRRYHAVAIPSLSDEQPRIVYDAFSQALPVLASDTPGLKDCVQHRGTGMIPAMNQPASWAHLFKWCADHPDELETMGRAGLENARALTHEEMHRKRWRLLVEMLEAQSRKSPAR